MPHYIWWTGDAICPSSWSEMVGGRLVTASTARAGRVQRTLRCDSRMKRKYSCMGENPIFMLAHTVTVAGSVFKLYFFPASSKPTYDIIYDMMTHNWFFVMHQVISNPKYRGLRQNQQKRYTSCCLNHAKPKTWGEYNMHSVCTRALWSEEKILNGYEIQFPPFIFILVFLSLIRSSSKEGASWTPFVRTSYRKTLRRISCCFAGNAAPFKQKKIISTVFRKRKKRPFAWHLRKTTNVFYLRKILWLRAQVKPEIVTKRDTSHHITS